MDVFELKNETATRWAFGSREIKNDLNYLEEAGARNINRINDLIDLVNEYLETKEESEEN